MGYQIIQQPNGLLAVMSSETDTLIAIDATREELEDWFAQEAADAARARTRAKIDQVLDPECPRPYHQFTLTWAEAMAEHRQHEGNRRDIKITFDASGNPVWHETKEQQS